MIVPKLVFSSDLNYGWEGLEDDLVGIERYASHIGSSLQYSAHVECVLKRALEKGSKTITRVGEAIRPRHRYLVERGLLVYPFGSRP